MTRSNLLWGLGGAIVGAIATYFVMEYIYDKEMAELYEDVESDAEDKQDGALDEEDVKKVIAIADAEQYVPDDDQEGFDKFLHVVSQEEHMEEDAAIVMEAIWMDENEEEVDEDREEDRFVAEDDDENDGSLQEDEEEMDEADAEEDDDMVTIDTYNGIYMIDVAEVSPGRRIVARFDHDTCNIEISTVMSVKTAVFDEVIEEMYIEELLGFEAFNTLMNAEPSKKERMIAVRNNLINLDFAISY